MIKLEHNGDEKSKKVLVLWYSIMKHVMKVTKISSDWRWLLWRSQNLKTRSQLWQRRNAGKYDLPSDKPTFVWCIICQVLAHLGWVSRSHRANYHQLRGVLIALGMQMQYYDALCRVTTLLSARRKPRLATSQIDNFQTKDIHGTSRSYASTTRGAFPETTISAGKNPSYVSWQSVCSLAPPSLSPPWESSIRCFRKAELCCIRHRFWRLRDHPKVADAKALGRQKLDSSRPFCRP